MFQAWMFLCHSLRNGGVQALVKIGSVILWYLAVKVPLLPVSAQAYLLLPSGCSLELLSGVVEAIANDKPTSVLISYGTVL